MTGDPDNCEEVFRNAINRLIPKLRTKKVLYAILQNQQPSRINYFLRDMSESKSGLLRCAFRVPRMSPDFTDCVAFSVSIRRAEWRRRSFSGKGT